MKIRKPSLLLCLALMALMISCTIVSAQPTSLTKDEMLYYTSVWKGDRFPDGRPKVSDDLVARMKFVSVTEAWQTLNGLSDNAGAQGAASFGEVRRSTYSNQYTGD